MRSLALGLLGVASACGRLAFDPVVKIGLAVDHTLVAATLADFPLLVSLTSDELVGVAPGGVSFTLADGTPLASEVTRFDPATGSILAWVELPNLSSTSDTLVILRAAPHQPTPATVWNAGFVSVWHLDDQPGTAARDSTPTGNDAADSGGLGALGEIGTANAVDGVRGFLTVGPRATLDVGAGEDFTLEGWFNRAAPDKNNFVIDKGRVNNACSGNQVGYWVNLTNNENILQVCVADGTNTYKVGSVTHWKTGASGWHAFAVVVNRPTGMGLWIDGQREATQAFTGGLGSLANPFPFVIGATSDGLAPFFGELDELRFSSVARSAAWISTVYVNESQRGVFVRVLPSAQLP